MSYLVPLMIDSHHIRKEQKKKTLGGVTIKFTLPLFVCLKARLHMRFLSPRLNAIFFRRGCNFKIARVNHLRFRCDFRAIIAAIQRDTARFLMQPLKHGNFEQQIRIFRRRTRFVYISTRHWRILNCEKCIDGSYFVTVKERSR